MGPKSSQASERLIYVQSPTGVQRPQAAELDNFVLVGESDLLQGLGRLRAAGWVRATLLNNPAGVANIPIVLLAPLNLDQFLVAFLTQVHLNRRGVAVADLVNPAVAAVPHFGLMAMAGLLVVPVYQVDVAIGPVAHVDKASPG